jgi:hypothetical protein
MLPTCIKVALQQVSAATVLCTGRLAAATKQCTADLGFCTAAAAAGEAGSEQVLN